LVPGPNPSVKNILFPEASGEAEISRLESETRAGVFPEPFLPEAPQKRTEALALLVRSLNLPPDPLSAALVSFARYFSLPLDPAALTKLRREALSLRKFRESAALAAAAAAGKGVELTPEALEKYTAAVDPDAREGQEGGGSPGEGRGGTGRDGGGTGGGDRGLSPETSGEDEGGGASVRAFGIPGAEEIRKISDDIDGKNPLLSLLNSIPGRDGKRWLVYPFQAAAGGKRFLVSIRVRAGDGNDAARLAVDVAGEDRRWLFVVNRPARSRRIAEPPKGGDAGVPPEPAPLLETRVSLWPPPGRRERGTLEREIREVLGPDGGLVILRDNEPLLAECRDEALFSINEEV
jgi:hypothetical protein